jgi:hypothetical protein
MMRLASRLLFGIFLPCIGQLAVPCCLLSQEPVSNPDVVVASADLPEAPQPQLAPAADQTPGQTQGQQTPIPPGQSTPPAPAPTPAQTPAAQDSSSSQAPAQQTETQKSQHDKAEEQIKEQEKQRTLGVVPAFNISYRADAVSLTAGQKLKLAFRSATDPVAMGIAFIVAGEHEAFDDDKGFGWGWEGYGKRSGAAYLDAFDGAIIGNGILPSILHQDPRYFRLGHGTVKHRLLYALATNVICKHDNTHKWQPNYSNVGGNIISGLISNLYYPSGDSGIGQTFTNGLTVTAEGGLGSVFQEFWPDISRKYFHKDPTNGLDAQVRAQDAANKIAAQKAKDEAKQNQDQKQNQQQK